LFQASCIAWQAKDLSKFYLKKAVADKCIAQKILSNKATCYCSTCRIFFKWSFSFRMIFVTYEDVRENLTRPKIASKIITSAAVLKRIYVWKKFTAKKSCFSLWNRQVCILWAV